MEYAVSRFPWVRPETDPAVRMRAAMPHTRRHVLVAATALIGIGAAGAAFAYRRQRRHRNELNLLGDGGNPLISFRIADAALRRLADLPGAVSLGAEPLDAKVTLYEFFDYNCPECRVAAGDILALARSDRDLRIVLVNNPVVSAQSAQAASVTIAVQKVAGSQVAAGLYEVLFSTRGRVDAEKALDAATACGIARSELESLMIGQDVQSSLQAQMRAASDLGLFATPAYVLGEAGLVGHPGPAALTRMVAAMQSCERVACG